jgi:hypothetical protein
VKSKELIRLLQEEDPTGETEVSVGNHDIFELRTEPAYWDGKLQLLIRDPAKAPYYDIVGGKYCTAGSKIVINAMSISDVLWQDPDATVDYSELGQYADKYREADEKTRRASRDVTLKVGMDAFYRWVKSKAEAIRPGDTDCRSGADYFFEKHLHVDDPLKELPKQKHVDSTGKEYECWPSVNDRRESGWDDRIEVYWRGGWGIKMKDGSAVEGE